MISTWQRNSACQYVDEYSATYSSQGDSRIVHAQVIKPKLSDEQKRQLKMTFNLMDADGGGTIDGRAITPGPSLPVM